MWTNLTKFWRKNEFKKHCMAKRACARRNAAKRDYISL